MSFPLRIFKQQITYVQWGTSTLQILTVDQLSHGFS